MSINKTEQQTNFYGIIQYELNYAKHDLKAGISYRHLKLNEDIAFTNTFLQRSYAGNYQRLPDTKSNPTAVQGPDFSKPYTLVNAQFTYNFKKFEVYAGCENIFDFRQKQPIISWQVPFSPYFDTSSVWGPTRGPEIYIGVKFKLE